MNIIEFINHVLIDEIRVIQQDEHHTYLSFSLISQGIELLGSLIDKDEFHKIGLSPKRFDAAINNFFTKGYKEYANKSNDFYLYKNLRCGMLHVLIPQNKLALGERKYDQGRYEHLKIYPEISGNNRLILIAEDFYEDFKCACKEVIEIISDKSIFDKFPDLNEASGVKKSIIKMERNIINTSL